MCLQIKIYFMLLAVFFIFYFQTRPANKIKATGPQIKCSMQTCGVLIYQTCAKIFLIGKTSEICFGQAISISNLRLRQFLRIIEVKENLVPCMF